MMLCFKGSVGKYCNYFFFFLQKIGFLYKRKYIK
jgi:hypothetical protein